MRMFLIAMCDIFLILYLTAMANVSPKTAFTINDFFELKSMYETLKLDKQESDAKFQDQIEQARLRQERLVDERRKQKMLLKQRSIENERLEKKLNQEKTDLESERDRLNKLHHSLVKSRRERDQIEQNLHEAEEMLIARQRTLNELSYNAVVQQQERQKIEASYQEELEKQKKIVEKNKQLLDKMQKRTELAILAVEEAENVQQLAVELKNEALKAKEQAEERAVDALAKSYKAEVERRNALKALDEAKERTKEAEKNTERLELVIGQIKQDGKTAYQNNVSPYLQSLKATYVRRVSNKVLDYHRELTLLPIEIDGSVYIIFPSKQVGFRQRSDVPPQKLIMTYQGQKITTIKMNKTDDLIAIEIENYQGKVNAPYDISMELKEFMPTLLSLRNDGNNSVFDAIRGVSDDYYIVKRDYLEEDEQQNLRYIRKGFRGTGTHGERIVRGDQLVDLNGRLIGIAADPDVILRINTVKDWEDVLLE